jgi:hypothetical protein
MGVKGKYEPLTDFLLECDENEITLTFEEISQIVVGGLPPSAYKRREIWANGHGGPTSISYLNAGYVVSKAVLPDYITFIKIDEEAPIHGARATSLKNLAFSPLLDVNIAVGYIKKYHQTSVNGKFTRFRSWIHCYKAFKKYRHDSKNVDLLCLHLAWYMASWGMLRGKSFLLQMDYLVHKPLIMQVLSGKYEQLFINNHTSETVQLTMDFSNDIKEAYGRNSHTQTFITKIILGIFGTAPAYDRLFAYSAKKYNVCSGTWGESSLKSLWTYYDLHRSIFENLKKELMIDGIEYTPMKLLDMCLWQIGFDELEGNE